MSSPAYFLVSNGPAITQYLEDFLITYCLVSCFLLLCALPLITYFKNSVLRTFVCIWDSIKCTYFFMLHTFLSHFKDYILYGKNLNSYSHRMSIINNPKLAIYWSSCHHQTKFNLLKKATLKNIENLQEAVKLQQMYTTTICSHTNSIYTKLAQFDRQVQMHCLYPNPQSDVVQLNALEYDSDINRQTDQVLTPSTAQQSPNAKNIKEDITSDATNSEQHTASFPDTDRPESQPPPVSDDTDYPGYQDTEQPRAEHPSDYRPQLEDIPELEDDEENWEEGQFADADFIDHHNTTEESDRICHKYSAHFKKVTDQGYSTYDSTMPGLEYQIPEQEYYNSDTRPKQYQRYQNPNVYLPPPPSTEDLHRWYGYGCGRAKHLELHSHRLYREKTRSLESRIARKPKKNQCQRERRSADI